MKPSVTARSRSFRKGLGVLAVAGTLLLAVAAPARAADKIDDTPGEQLGGYVAQAAGSVVSFQPIIPAFLPTGDAPFEVTFSLTGANVKSGGNSFARGSLVWPGSAAANLRPLLNQVDQAKPIAGLLPDYPLKVEASQVDGEKETSVPPGMVMRAQGEADRSKGESRIADFELPGTLRVDTLASVSSARATDSDVTSLSKATLEGVDVLNGFITIEEIRSLSEVASNGVGSTSEGDVDIVGMKIAGFDVSFTDDGIQVDGAPEEASALPGAGGEPFPSASPEAALQQALEAAGVRITVFEPTGAANKGFADRVSTGLLISIDNPAGGQGPVPPSRFDILLASTAASVSATEPFTFDLPEITPSSAVSKLTGAPTPSVLGATASNPGAGDSRLLSVPSQSGPSVSSGPAVNPFAGTPSAYTFAGVPARLGLLLLALAGAAAWYVRKFIDNLLVKKE